MPRRPLTERELAQRRAASQAAAQRRATEGLTERELAQRQLNAWRQGAAGRAEFRRRRQKADRERRQRIIERTGSFKLSDRDRDLTAFRLHRRWGIPLDKIDDYRLDAVGFDNPALKSFLTKWENLRNKGFTPDQAMARLEGRWQNVRRRDQLVSTTILDLIRENYPSSRREVRRHRKPLTERQQARRRERDAETRRRRAA